MSHFSAQTVGDRPHRLPSRQERNAFRVQTSVFVLAMASLHKPLTETIPRLHQVSLSSTGIGLTTNTAYRPSQRLMLEFALPPNLERPLYAHVNVVYCYAREDGSYRLGLKFEWLSNEDHRRVRDFCLAEERSLLRKQLENLGE